MLQQLVQLLLRIEKDRFFPLSVRALFTRHSQRIIQSQRNYVVFHEGLDGCTFLLCQLVLFSKPSLLFSGRYSPFFQGCAYQCLLHGTKREHGFLPEAVILLRLAVILSETSKSSKRADKTITESKKKKKARNRFKV